MYQIIAFNTTIKCIVNEVEKFDAIEQQSILAYLKAKRLQLKRPKPVSKPAKPLSMATIDSIKHKSR